MTDEIIKNLHEELQEKRCIILKGTINDRVIEGIVMQIIEWNKEDDRLETDGPRSYSRKDNPIKIYIHSGGGLVIESLAVISAITTSKTPIYTYALGEVASAAFAIFIVGHKRFSQPYTRFMYHDMTGGCIGKTQEREENLIEQKRLSLIYQGLVKQYTKVKQATLDKIHKEKLDQFWLAPDAKRVGIFDSYF
jgi:ATP-dependent Clp protease protease subunit